MIEWILGCLLIGAGSVDSRTYSAMATVFGYVRAPERMCVLLKIFRHMGQDVTAGAGAGDGELN